MNSSSATNNSTIRNPSQKEIREHRRGMKSACMKCGGGESENLKKCSHCGGRYCSRECQVADWPNHKGVCLGAVSSTTFVDVNKLCQTFAANDFLKRHLEVLIALELKLLDKKKKDLDELFMVQVFVSFEPTDALDLFRLMTKNGHDDRAMQGMLQICMINSGWSITEKFGGSTDPTQENNRAVLRGLGLGYPRGTLEFIHCAGGRFTILHNVFLIAEDAMEQARNAKEIEIPVTFTGRTHKKPVSVLNYMEYINALIRQDIENRWLLRKNMERRDKKTIRDAFQLGDDEDAYGFGAMMKQKVESEIIFKEAVNLYSEGMGRT
ncbi:hypothetical protein GALMADRAFT_256041 [Galerina marginata CBS 339.88]|uniref:MYND-type domain-containing protein n=1 Tax=Galerina marginata (strain CBS 339.88) TaxID=685588 RepID=A0A067SE26_GALM3|nr:hypothetical protein GALMADRAFT_256041 [Galerina marginata CBS 339.88]